MRKRKKLLQEESKLLRSYFINLLADLIRLHYKYYKNEKFDTFEQYLNGYKTYELFFAHYELTEPIHCISVAQERLEE